MLNVDYGAHDGDFEHVTLQFARRDDGRVYLARAYFGAHTTSEGVWRAPDAIEWHRDRPVAYVAYGSHGNYPHSGVYVRMFGVVSDYCDCGTLWEPSRVVVVNNASESWHRYTGRFNISPLKSTLRSKTWGDPHPETNKSTTPLERALYLYPENFDTY